MTKNVKLPNIDKGKINVDVRLPFNGNIVTDKTLSFSFSCFDREHELFNMGSNNGAVDGKWFIDLLECLKDVCNKNMYELQNDIHDLHRINWNNTNVKSNLFTEYKQCEFWQFRINKSKGRVIGTIIDNVFYVIWLDRHHNLTNSNGYGGISKYKRPSSTYEDMREEIIRLRAENENLKKDLQEAYDCII